MPAAEEFEAALSARERRAIDRLRSPIAVQGFLDDFAYSVEPIYRCPLRALRERTGHCFDGAVLAAALLRRIGFPPLVLDMLPNERDDDHVLAVFRHDGAWGAVAKSNFVGLRYREPVYRGLRELVMSYFEQHYNVAREKTLRAYTRPLNLCTLDAQGWTTRDAVMETIAARLDGLVRCPLITPRMAESLALVDERSYRAGMHGADPAGLWKPGKG